MAHRRNVSVREIELVIHKRTRLDKVMARDSHTHSTLLCDDWI